MFNIEEKTGRSVLIVENEKEVLIVPVDAIQKITYAKTKGMLYLENSSARGVLETIHLTPEEWAARTVEVW
jgi:hypothetical protein